MTFFLPERTPEVQAQADAIFSGKVPSFSEIAGAQAEFDRIDRDLRNRALRDEGDFLRSIQERLGDEFAPGEAPDPRVTPIERSNDHIFDAVKRAQEARPDEFRDLPVDFDQFQTMNIERRAAEFGELEHVLSSAPPGSMAAVASITGSLQAAVTDPETLAMMLFGGNPASGILRFAAAEGGLAALDEARTLPDQFARQRELGGPEPAPVSQVATAFGVGAALGGVVGGAVRFVEFQRGRSRTTGERRPADQSQLQFAQDVDAAQTAMEQGGDFPTGRDQTPGDQSGNAAPARPEPGTLAALTGPRMGDFDFSATGNASPQTNRIGYVVGKLLALGYEPHHAIGLTANLMQESGPGLNTRAVGDGGNAFGMGQWNGPRRRQYLAFAQRKGRDPGDLDTQIEFLDWELKNTERGAAAKILNTNNARDAAIMASTEFWRPGVPHLSRRAAFADALAEQFEAG
ncbi:MAG: hypothetical protein KBT70_05775, partial [Roseovarius sp.]|uniref:phage tail tip lysozyme n=1 Tax=Roseovarius sp. TaxID=1486281 RepID=UPI001B3DE7AE